ncbi:MAG TPA: CRTAC1 family protein, partial [Planctomycetaceae bacterium]|nr:CRTAC1 family protein [Planctomycetaceae bacterium]
RNDQSLGHHWLRIRLRGNGTSCNRDAIGATIELRVGDNIVKRQVSRTRSYLSQVSADITIGLGKSEQVDQLLIRWPDGSPQNVEGPIAAGTVLTVEQK